MTRMTCSTPRSRRPTRADARPAARRPRPTRADRDGLLDVAYRTVDSPLGPLLLAATPAGLVRVAFDREDHDAVLAALAADVSPRSCERRRRLDAVAASSTSTSPAAAARSTCPSTSSSPTASAATCSTTCATSRTARPRATRRRRPPGRPAPCAPSARRAPPTRCPLVVPCHRVVRSDGSIGQYRGGAEAKRSLLALEAAA